MFKTQLGQPRGGQRLQLLPDLVVASANPARLLGLNRGEVAVGAYADLITFHYEPGATNFLFEQVIVQGQRLEHRAFMGSA